MKIGVIIAALVGLAVATAIVGYIGFGAVFAAISTLGWRGLAFLTVYSAAPFFLLGSAWFLLDAGAPLRRWGVFIWARVVRDSGSELLPFSHLGGFVIGARAAVLQGITSTTASATTIVDVTTELIAQLGFTSLGLAMLLLRLGGRSGHDGLIGSVSLGLALSAIGAVAFIALQRRGSGLAERLARRFLPGAAVQAGLVGGALRALYDNPWRIGAAVLVHFAAWTASAVGVWLALRLAGVEIGLGSVLAIESLIGAVRSAAFVAPMGIGVQEGAYALLGPLFGLGPDLSLALSLLKRGRDLAIGVPALLIWQGLEGLRAVKPNAGDGAGDAG
jgi:putative membrane protein